MKSPFSFSLFIVLCGFLVGCAGSQQNETSTIPIDQFLAGSWLEDSTVHNYEPFPYPQIRFLEFNEGGRVSDHTYYSKRDVRSQYDLNIAELNDTTLTYALSAADSSFTYFLPTNYGHYRLEVTGPNNFTMTALFETTTNALSLDSIIYYSRVSDVDTYLEPHREIAGNNQIEYPEPELKYVHGFWRQDSVEHATSLTIRAAERLHFGTNDSMYFWRHGFEPPLNKAIHCTLDSNYFHLKGRRLRIAHLDSASMILAFNETSSRYEVQYYSRVNPNAVGQE